MESGEKDNQTANSSASGPTWAEIQAMKIGQVVSVRFPLPTLYEIEQVRKEYHKRSRNDTIVQLVQMALYLLKRKDMVQDMGPTQFEEWRDMLTSHQLVDWAHELEWYQLSVINEIISSEVKSRSLAGALNNPGAKNATRKF